MPTKTDAGSSTGLHSRKTAAKYLDISERTLDELIKAGHIAAKRFGRSVKIETSELNRFIDDLPSYEPGVNA